MLEKRDDVIAAYPDGGTGEVAIHAKKTGAMTEKTAKKLIESDKQFKVKSFSKKVLATAKKPAMKAKAMRKTPGE